MEQVVVDYLRHLGIPVSKEYCKKLIASHPDYPSLLGVSDTMQQLGIPCQIGRIDQEHLSKIDFPFLIHLENEAHGLVLVKSENDLSKDHIDLEHWKGVVLKAETIDVIADTEHNKQYKNEKLTRIISVLLIISLLGLILVPVIQVFSWIQFALFFTASIGVLFGYLLIAKELGVTFKPVESFCNTSTRVNCDRILSSDGAKILSFFSLSEVVLSYFAFQLVLSGIVIPVSDTGTSYLLVLLIGSILTIPVIIYSIYYQAIKAKTWCTLCMMVNAVLGIQVLFFGFLFINGAIPIQEIELLPFVFSAFLFVAIASSVILFKSVLTKLKNALSNEIIANRVKLDPGIFTRQLFSGEKVRTRTLDKEMIIGDENAPVKLIMVANLHCYPCKIAFENVIELINRYPNKVSVEFRFLLSRKKLDDEIPASTYLIKYWEKYFYGKESEQEYTRKLLYDWYSHLNVLQFGSLYPDDLAIIKNEEDGLDLQHYHWIKENEINRTPTFFLNGYLFPSKYTINDLYRMIPGLAVSIWEQGKESQKRDMHRELVK